MSVNNVNTNGFLFGQRECADIQTFNFSQDLENVFALENKILDKLLDNVDNNLTFANNIIKYGVQDSPYLPQPLRESIEMTQYIINKKLKNVITYENHNITMPSIKGMQKIANHYEEKYQITIRFCYTGHVSCLFEALSKQEDQKPFGIIVFSGDYGHITPLLFHAQKGQYEILLLDTLGQPDLISFNVICKNIVNLEENWKKMVSNSNRQADRRSCNTEGLTILRNALLHIRYLGEDFSNLENMMKNTTLNNTGQWLEVTLPAEWTYVDQIYERSNADKSTYVLRELFSKNLKKRQQPRTVEEFRDHHQQNVSIQHQICLIHSADTKQFIKDAEEVVNQSDGILTLQNDSIAWKTEKKINTYLVTKGHKMTKFISKYTEKS